MYKSVLPGTSYRASCPEDLRAEDLLHEGLQHLYLLRRRNLGEMYESVLPGTSYRASCPEDLRAKDLLQEGL